MEQITFRTVDVPENTQERTVFRANTAGLDRHRTIIKPDGLDFTNFRKNPIFVWAHAGSARPAEPEHILGKVVDIKATPEFVDVEVEWADQVNQKARLAKALVDSGFLRAVSIGFIPKKIRVDTVETERGPEDVRVFEEAELVEVSLVPVPSNPDALAVVRDLLGAIGEDEIRGVVPGDASRKTAPLDTPWKAPFLRDFTDKEWDDLSDAEKRRIARHFAWAEKDPADNWSQLKLPHHRASDGAVVWNGVRAAMSVLFGARAGVKIPDADRRKVYDHLARHYRDFGKPVPEYRDLVEGRGLEDLLDDSPPEGADDDSAKRYLRALRLLSLQIQIEQLKEEIANG